jgi:hypothetical protein
MNRTGTERVICLVLLFSGHTHNPNHTNAIASASSSSLPSLLTAHRMSQSYYSLLSRRPTRTGEPCPDVACGLRTIAAWVGTPLGLRSSPDWRGVGDPKRTRQICRCTGCAAMRWDVLYSTVLVLYSGNVLCMHKTMPALGYVCACTAHHGWVPPGTVRSCKSYSP